MYNNNNFHTSDKSFMPRSNQVGQSKNKVLLFLALLFTGMSASAFDKNAQNIRFYTHSAAHALTKNDRGEAIGVPNMGRRAIDIEVIRWILNDVGLKNNIRNSQFTDAFRKLQTLDNRALFNVLRTPERENTVQWVGPIGKYTSYFYESVENPTRINSMEDAKKVTAICVLSGNVHYTLLTRLGFENIVSANSYTQCADLLLKGRVDLMPAGESPRFVNRKNYTGKIVRTPVEIATRRGYLALSLNIPEKTINELQKSLIKLKASKDYQKILDTYSAKE